MSGVLTALKVAGVFLLLAATLIYIRRHDRGRLRIARKSNRPVSVLGQARLSKAASVAVVDIGGTAYAVAVTDQRVSLLLPDPVDLPEVYVEADEDLVDELSPVDGEQPGDGRAPRAAAATYVGRFERSAERPSFGEALGQQFRALTRRETPVPLDAVHDLPRVTVPDQAVPTADGTAADVPARTPGTFPG